MKKTTTRRDGSVEVLEGTAAEFAEYDRARRFTYHSFCTCPLCCPDKPYFTLPSNPYFARPGDPYYVTCTGSDGTTTMTIKVNGPYRVGS